MSDRKPSTRAKKPRVGIFMPAFNQGPYIHEAIESLKKQTFQDFEVVIADDASTDGVTIPTLERIKYDKATVYLNKRNQGVGKLARGYYKKLANEYIFVLCADDKIHPDYIKECVNYLDKYPQAAAVGTFIQEFGDSHNLRKLDKNKIKLPQMLVENNYLGSSMMRYSALKQIGFGNKEKAFQKHNDYDRWVSMLSNGWILGVIDRPLFFYRILSTSLSKSINVQDELEFRKAFIKKHLPLFQKHVEYVTINSLTSLYKNHNWQNELQEGRDWLEKEYRRLTKENIRLHKKLDAIQNHPLLRYATKIKKLPLPKPRKKG